MKKDVVVVIFTLKSFKVIRTNKLGAEILNLS